MEEFQLEEKNKKKAMAVSLGAHVLLLILFFLVAAWNEPDPPIPEYGIELSFIGTNSNLAQSTKAIPVNESLETDEAVDSSNDSDEVTDSKSLEQPETQEESTEQPAQEPISEDINSPDVNNDSTEPVTTDKAEVSEESTENTDSKETVTEESGNSELVQEEPEPELDDRAIFQDGDINGNESGGENTAAGSSLNMSGWIWDFQPEPDDKSIENGKIVFKITVDDEGEIIGIKTLEKTVSPVVEKVYKNAVMELTFSKTADNKSVAPSSSGTITFIIQSK